MGEEIIGRLVEVGRVSDVADYYSLTQADLEMLDMGRTNKDGNPIHLGTTVALKLLDAIKQSKSRSFDRVIGGLGIRHVGKNTARDLAEASPRWRRSHLLRSMSCQKSMVSASV